MFTLLLIFYGFETTLARTGVIIWLVSGAFLVGVGIPALVFVYNRAGNIVVRVVCFVLYFGSLFAFILFPVF
jgi:hypothetical protein